MMRFKGMRHLALTVEDPQRSARFYEEAFGMRRFGPAKGDGQLVPLVSPGLRDQVSLHGPDAPDEIAVGRAAANPPGTVDHFGTVVAPGTSLERVREHLESCGAAFLGRVDVNRRVRSLFFRTPDGHVIQVIRFPRLARHYVAALPILQRWGRQGGRSRPMAPETGRRP
jgi:catechol 2,3-dioxygenase-like lactoylglutathione lyase family enzyme